MEPIQPWFWMNLVLTAVAFAMFLYECENASERGTMNSAEAEVCLPVAVSLMGIFGMCTVVFGICAFYFPA